MKKFIRGSNTFGEKESHDYLLHPITLRIYNADHTADYANGFAPDVLLNELVMSQTLYPLGDPKELLLSEALQQISGQGSTRAFSQGEHAPMPFRLPKIEHKKIQGFIYST